MVIEVSLSFDGSDWIGVEGSDLALATEVTFSAVSISLVGSNWIEVESTGSGFTTEV